jgi:carbon-monoxide dehydrogenase medium subunit
VSPFELLEPSSLGEALDLLAAGVPGTRAASGCTALMLMMKAQVLQPTQLVSLRALAPAMSAIEVRDGELAIGALATLSAIERSPLVAREAPVLARALATLANVRVRNVATLGGHLAHADPHMDLPPVLCALGASVVIANRSGSRSILLEELITGYLETALAEAELITAVRIPLRPGLRAQYVKCTARSADDWPTLGVAVAFEAHAQRVSAARVVISAAVDRLTRLASVERLVEGAAMDESVLARAGELAAAEARPIADQHGSAAYKRQLIRVYVARALRRALAVSA